jgi:hypothetical protein
MGFVLRRLGVVLSGSTGFDLKVLVGIARRARGGEGLGWGIRWCLC